MSKKERRKHRSNRRRHGTRAQPPRPISVRKKLLFAALTTAIFFGLVEVVLYLAGIHPQIVQRDPYVGFTSRIPLFVPSPSSDGQVITTAENKLRWFNQQSFPRQKPIDAYRIFCLGGSTTYGRPYEDITSFCGWLREFLPAADPSHRWEVINAGGISYASYRVALVLEELVAYEPDLIIVYTGHNEFLEHRTYDSLKRTSSLVKHLNAMLSHTRTYSALQTILRRDQADIPSSADNLLPGEVATKLDKGVGPDAYTRDDTLREQIHAHFQLNLGRIVDLARTAGADVLLVTPASNLRHCSPFKSEVRHDLGVDQQRQLFDQIERAQLLLSRNEADAALRAIDQALQIDDRYAAAHFLRGQCLDQLRRYEEARTAFTRARDEDICPLRALSGFRETVLDVAREKQVSVVDFQALIDEKSTDGIPGDDLFLDHVHPTIEGHRLLALQIVDGMIEQTMVHASSDWGPDAIDRVTQRVTSRVDQVAQGNALRNLAKVFAWAGKREEANRMAIKADALLSADVETLYLAANALIEKGELDSAISKLKQVIAADPNHAPSYSSLGVAYERKGLPKEAERRYKQALEIDADHTAALNNLGAHYLKAGQIDLAAPLFERAVQINPRYAKGHHNLGVLYVQQRRWPAAIESLKKAVAIDGDFAKAHADLGSVYESQADFKQAVFHYRQALRLDGKLLMSANSLAWILATSSDDTVRNGKEALQWALHCAEGTAYQNPAVFNTLAAAYAASGDFSGAVQWQTRALQAAPAALRATCLERLGHYQAGRALHNGR